MVDESWEQRREQFIEKLRRTENLFSELSEIDNTGMVIGNDEIEALKKLQARNAEILKKLESKEFSVAIIGLEKAGKSTLGNALIKSIVLPEYTERCTYTKTEIRAGEEDKTEISFYNKEEFNQNFKKMCDDVQYSGKWNLSEFNQYWEEVSQDKDRQTLFRTFNGTTVEDIREILKGVPIIGKLLGTPAKEFTNPKDARVYITGIKEYNKEDNTVVRTAEPYAVKNVKITSTQLGDMSNIVLYDVPGFDSPTEIHKKQTEEMLLKADAILLVTDVGNRPNLTGTQLDMLKKLKDEDGVNLNEKAFIFGNRIDRAGNKKQAEDNGSALRKDAVHKYNITTESRVIVGSAKAYLEKNQLLSEDDKARGLTGADNILDSWGMPYGRDELYQKMQEYYATDRFVVIKKRADKILEDIEKFLKEILNKFYSKNSDGVNPDYGKIILGINAKIQGEFIKEAKLINDKYSDGINSQLPFSSCVSSDLPKIFPKVEDFPLNFIEDVENETYKDTTGNYPLSEINANLRKKLQQMFVTGLVKKVATITNEEQGKIREELVDTFLEIIGTDSINKDKLKDSVNKLFFGDYLIENGSECHFNILVERFSTGLVEALIRNPFASQERENKVWQIQSDLIHLASYYYDLETTGKLVFDNKHYYGLLGKILAHEESYLNEDKPVKYQLNSLKENFCLKTKEEMLKYLDEDIDILNDITQKAMIKAIGLERAFVSVFTKNINLIRDSLVQDGQFEGSKLGTWIAENVGIIRESECADIIREQENNQIRKVIVQSIERVLANWKNN